MPTVFRSRVRRHRRRLPCTVESYLEARLDARDHLTALLKRSSSQPSSNLVIKLKTAKALGLEVPWFLQQRADELIE